MRPGLESIEVASQDELRGLQLARLEWSLAHAHNNVPHYQRRFKDHGVQPEDLKSLEDLAKFPFTTKGDLRDNYPFGMFAVPRDRVVRRARCRAARRESRRWLDTPHRIWILGRARLPGAYVQRAECRGTSFILPMATDSSPEDSERTWRRAVGLYGCSHVGGSNPEAGSAHPRFRARPRDDDSILHGDHCRGVSTSGNRPIRATAACRDLWRGTVDQGNAPRSRGAWASLRWTSTGSPR